MGLPIAYQGLANLSERIMNLAWGSRKGGDKINKNKGYYYDTGRYEPSGGTAQATYLLPRGLQKAIFLQNGYIEGTPGDYGLVKKAVGNDNFPVFQTSPDKAKRDDLVVIGNTYNGHNGIAPSDNLYHAGHFPTSIYIDADGNFFAKSWDLNDYGNSRDTGGANYGHDQWKANFLDIIGSPVVVTTGYQPVQGRWVNSVTDPEDLTINNLYLDEELQHLFENFAKTHHMRRIDGEWVTTTDKDLVVTPTKTYWE